MTQRNPRGSFWAKDDSKLGQAMLEKMGWSKGKGLGIDEQGDTDPLKLSISINNKGIGYKENSEEWMDHHDAYEDVLAALNKNHSDCGMEENNKKSLEAISKNSRARVHYQKFTRGKDVSCYSAEALACITGAKGAKGRKHKRVAQQEEAKAYQAPTMDQYFNSKLRTLRSQTARGLIGGTYNSENRKGAIIHIPEMQFTPQRKNFSFNLDEKLEDDEEKKVMKEEEEEQVEIQKGKKKKKKLKQAKKTKENHDEIQELNDKEDLSIMKKKKMLKMNIEEEGECVMGNKENMNDGEEERKKKGGFRERLGKKTFRGDVRLVKAKETVVELMKSGKRKLQEVRKEEAEEEEVEKRNKTKKSMKCKSMVLLPAPLLAIEMVGKIGQDKKGSRGKDRIIPRHLSLESLSNKTKKKKSK